MKKLEEIIDKAQNFFRARLEKVAAEGGLSEQQYIRYLTMQYHLTKGVQRPFFQIAAHEDMSHRRTFRKFLVEFANEEELHFEIALKDLSALGVEPLPCPLDVKLWWSYFNALVEERPFVRLGATTILENLSGKCQNVISTLLEKAPYLTKNNTRFLTIHRHDLLPHGDQIMDALREARLEPHHLRDLEQGAEEASVMYFRMSEWAFRGEEAMWPR